MIFLFLLLSSTLAVIPAKNGFLEARVATRDTWDAPPEFLTTFNILGNGYAGTLTLLQMSNGSYGGTIQYDNAPLPNGNPGPIEKLERVIFLNDYYATYVTFYRPATRTHPAERYWGLCVYGVGEPKKPYSRTIHGHFLKDGDTVPYPFDAQFDASEKPIVEWGIEHFGSFGILANGWPGVLLLAKDAVTGSARFDNAALPNGVPNPSEPVDQIHYIYKYKGWYLTWYRTNADQQYYGIYSYGAGSNQLAGHFTQGKSTFPWPFDGSKRKEAYGPFVPYLGWNSVLSNGFPGYASFWDTNPQSGYVYYSNGPVPNTVHNGQENLSGISWTLHLNNGFYYGVFTRPNGQVYYGLVDDRRNTVHGHFTDPGYAGPWPFNAVRNYFGQ